MAVRLGAACRHARSQTDVRLLDVALEAGLTEPTISKFERGAGGWRDVDRIVAAYGELLGVEPDELWGAALERTD